VKIRGRGRLCAQQFCAGSGLKRFLMDVEEFNALPRRRHRPQQGAEGASMHHAEADMFVRLKGQRIDIIPPNGKFSGLHQTIVVVARRQLAKACCRRRGGN